MIPASRGIITRTTYLRLLPGFPPFFFQQIPSQLRPTTSSTALGLFPPCVAYNNLVQYTPRSSHSSAYICPVCRQFVCSLFLCTLQPNARDRIGYLSHRLSVSKIEAEGFCFWNVAVGFLWLAGRSLLLHFLPPAVPGYCSPPLTVCISTSVILGSSRPRLRLGARKKNGRGAHPKLAT